MISACTTTLKNIKTDNIKTYQYSELKKNKNNKDLEKHFSKSLIIVFKKGDKIPLHFYTNNKVFEIESGKNFLTLKKDIYFYINYEKKRLYVSPDKKVWEPVPEFKAIGELFGMKHGNIQFGFAFTKEKKKDGFFLQFNQQ